VVQVAHAFSILVVKIIDGPAWHVASFHLVELLVVHVPALESQIHRLQELYADPEVSVSHCHHQKVYLGCRKDLGGRLVLEWK